MKISFSHPQEQRTPTTEHLQRWYMEILSRANREGIVTDVTNLTEEYLTGRYKRS